MTTWQVPHGAPEPEHHLVLTDRHGDEWRWDEDEDAWTTPETAPFPWSYMRRAWFPMTAREDTGR